MINEPNLTIDRPQMHQNPKSFKKPGLHFRQSRNGAVEKYPNEKRPAGKKVRNLDILTLNTRFYWMPY